RFNAFMAGRRIFIHTGALMTAGTPNQIIGVISHEAGHIAGEHQHRLREQIDRARSRTLVAAVLGVGASAAGPQTASDSLGGDGAGLSAGGAEAARRSLLGYQRTEEITADRPAVDYLERTGQSGRGMLETFERMAGSLALAGVNTDPYQLSHPMPHERIANLK